MIMTDAKDNYVGFIRSRAFECVRRYCVPVSPLRLGLKLG